MSAPRFEKDWRHAVATMQFKKTAGPKTSVTMVCALQLDAAGRAQPRAHVGAMPRMPASLRRAHADAGACSAGVCARGGANSVPLAGCSRAARGRAPPPRTRPRAPSLMRTSEHVGRKRSPRVGKRRFDGHGMDGACMHRACSGTCERCERALCVAAERRSVHSADGLKHCH